MGREAAFGGGVDDEDDFVLERGEVVGLAFFCRGSARGVVFSMYVCFLGVGDGGRGKRVYMGSEEDRRTVFRFEVIERGCGRHGAGGYERCGSRVDVVASGSCCSCCADEC